ncbi:MAG: hypothetical protein PHO31_00515 [Candidatus Pacebacteria bacterium]|nr:hypothetical protein [Candidatus Paceibacterota bacterium]
MDKIKNSDKKNKMIIVWSITIVIVIAILILWYFQNKIIFSEVGNTQTSNKQSQKVNEFKENTQEMKEILSDFSFSMRDVNNDTQSKIDLLIDLSQKYQNEQISKEEFELELKKYGFTDEEIKQIENELEDSNSNK